MPKNKEDNVSMSMEEEVEQTFVPIVVVKETPVVRMVSFTQWAARRNIKKQHMGGLMAHIKDHTRNRSMEDWDKAVSGY